MTRLADGTGHPALRGLPAVWLRANCPCPGCQDPGSGQRLVAVTDLPADVTVAGVLASDGTVEVIFGPDGPRAVFAAGPEVWLGGTKGALYHSSDGGEQWRRVSIASCSTTVTDDAARCERKYVIEAPIIPAPTTTMRGVFFFSSLITSSLKK